MPSVSRLLLHSRHRALLAARQAALLTASLTALLTASGTAAAECPAQATTAELTAALEGAEVAWRAADESRFFLRMEEAQLLLPCLTEPLDPALAARTHRDTGLWLYATGHRARAAASFGSARRSSPGEGLPSELVPAGHPARALFEDARPDALRTALPPPAEGVLLFDGLAQGRPAGGPTIAQLQVRGGDVAWTARLRPGEAVPDYAVAPPEPPSPLEEDGRAAASPGPSTLPAAAVATDARSGRTGLGRPLAVGAGALALGGGALTLAARSSQARFREEPPGDLASLDALYARNRTTSTAAAVLLGTAGAVGVVAVVTW